MEGPNRAVGGPLMRLAVALVVITAGANGGYTVQKSMNQCAGYCKGTSKFNYEPGTVYHYDYEVDISSSIEGAVGPGDEASRMFMRAKAVLAALDSPCDLTLTLKEVRLYDPENADNYGGTEEFAEALQKNPLRFSLQHGRVEELCSLPGEHSWVLNVKRGLLSALQNSMDDLKVSQRIYETDITGSCETQYTALKDMWWEEELWGGYSKGRPRKGATPMTTIRRSKDLSTCSERNTFFLSLQANPTGRSKAKRMLRSTHECEQTVSEKPTQEAQDRQRTWDISSEEDDDDEDEKEFESVGGILLRSECRETHLFEPFSYRESGATTNITTRLILKGKEPAPPPRAKASGKANPIPVAPYTYSTLLFDHSTDDFAGKPSDIGSEEAAAAAEGAIQAMDAATVDGVSGDAPTSFAGLIAALRRLSHSQLMTLFKKAGQGRSRKFLLDAMPVVATAASMSAFRDLYRSGDVSEEEMDSWMGGLAFLKRPTLPMIAAVTPLLEGNPRPNAVLGVTALVHSYCRYGGGDKRSAPLGLSKGGRDNSTSSEEDESVLSTEDVFNEASCREKLEVRTVIDRLEDMIGQHGCRFGRREEKRASEVYLAFKGMGNAGVAPSPPAAASIALCYKDPENPNDLRLAAIDVLRRVPCSSSLTLRSELLNTYTNVSAGPKETEVRIAAYLATMHCPSLEVMRRIEDTLHREEVNQVGSFVWTHLNNLRSAPSSASEPYSGALSELLASKTLRRKFRSDARRFSRHYRISTGDTVDHNGATRDWDGAFGGEGGVSALGAGADAEAAVILSPESYIPRSAALNLTVRLFGAEVDLLDIGARVEGLEPLVESVFGPGGVFSDEMISKKSRGKREESNSISQIAEVFRSRSEEKHKPTEPRGSGYIRIFGNELSYGRFRGLGEMLATIASRVGSVDASTGSMRGMLRDPISQLVVALAQKRELEYSHSVAFLNAALVAPSIAGLPLSLVANGTASIAMTAKGRIDLTKRSEGAFEAEGVLAPSAAIMVTGTMSVSAYDFARSGLRLEASLQTNTRAEGSMRFKEGKLAEMSITAPRAAGEEIISVRSQLFALGSKVGQMKPLSGRREGREEAESCTPRFVSKAVGCEICARASYPNATGDDSSPRFPLTGPALVSINLGRTDTFEKYVFKYEYKDEVREEERHERRGIITDDEYLEEMRLGGKRFRRYRNVLLLFDTPGSKTDRRIRGSLAIEGGVGGASLVQASVATPWTRTLEVTAGLANTASARGVAITAVLGDETVVTAQAELRSVQRRPGGGESDGGLTSGRYEPSVAIAFRGRTLFDLRGRVDYVQGTKYSGEVELTGDLIEAPVSITGNVAKIEGRYEIRGSVKSAIIDGEVQGNFKKTVGIKRKGMTNADKDAGKFVNAKITFKYSLRGGDQQTFDVSARYLRNAKGALAKDSAYLTILSTQFPEYEIDAIWDSSTSEGPYFEGRGRFTLGKDGPRWETRPLLVLRGMDHLAFRFFIACRAKKLLYDLSLKHQVTDKALNQHALLRMGSHHEISFHLNATSRGYPTARYTVESEFRLPRSLHVGQRTSHGPGQRVLAFRASVDEVRRRTYEVGGGVEWWWTSVIGAAKASATYSDKGNRTNSDRRIEGKVWVVHGRDAIDTVKQEPSLDFALQVTQADKRARLTAHTEKPRKYKLDVMYVKNGLGEHSIEGWAELSMGKRYDGKAVLSDGEDTKSAYLELGLGRRMSLDAKLHVGEGLNGLEIELYWDKDMELKLSTGATVEFLGASVRPRQRKHGNKVPETANHGLAGSAWLEYPGRNIRAHGVIIPDEVTADLSWASDREISLALRTMRRDSGANFSFSLQTPFQGIEKQSASAMYNWDGKRFYGELDAKWKMEKQRLSTELTMVLPRDGASPWESNADLELHIKSTMQSIRDALFSVVHRTSVRPLGTNTTARVQWDNAEAFFANLEWHLTQSSSRKALEGSAALRSSGSHLRSFSADFVVGREGESNADARASLSWRRPFDLEKRTVNLGLDLSGLKFGSGYINISVPIGDHNNMSTTFEYQSGADIGGLSRISSELYFDGERTALASVEGFFSGPGAANLDGHLQTPWFPRIDVAMKHESRGMEWLREALVLKYGGESVAEMEVDAALRSSRDFVVRVTGGVSGGVASAKVEHLLASKKVRSVVELTLGGETSSAVLEARDEEEEVPRGQNWRPRVLHGSMTVSSPRLKTGRLRFAVDFAKTGKGNFETSLLAPGFTAHHSLTSRDILNWESRLDAHRGWEGYVKLPVVNVTLINSFDGSSFDHFSYTYMRGLEHPVLLNLGVRWGGENFPEDMGIISVTKAELPWTYPLTLELKIPKSRITEEGNSVIEPRAIVTYGEEQKNFTIVSKLQKEGPMTSITMGIIMEKCKEMEFGIKYDLISNKKIMNVFAKMDDRKKAEALLTVSFPSSLGIKAFMKISPASSTESKEMTLEFDIMAPEKSLKLKVDIVKENDVKEAKLDMMAKVKLESKKYSASLVMEAPSQLSFFADADLTKQSKLAIVTIRKNGSDFLVLSGSALADDNSARVSANMKSGMEGLEKVSLMATYDKIDEGHYRVDATLDRDGLKSQIDGKLKIDENTTEMQVICRLPAVGYEYTKAEAMFAASPTPSFLLGFQTGTSIYRVSGNGVSGVGYFNASASVTTPIEGFREIVASASHTADALSGYMDGRLLLDVDGAETSIFGEMKCPEYTAVKASLSILTPLEGFEKFDIAIDYDASKKGKLDGKAHITTPEGTSQMILSGIIDEVTQHDEGRILVSSPYLPRNIGSFGVEAEYIRRRKGEVRINIGNRIAAYTASVAAIEKGVTAVVMTPIEGYRRVSLTFVKETDANTAVVVTLTKEKDRYKVTGKIDGLKNRSATILMDVETVFSGWEQFGVKAYYDFSTGKEMKAGFEGQRNNGTTLVIGKVTGRLARRAGRASVLTRWNFGASQHSEFSVDGIYDMDGTEKSLDLHVKTPFARYEAIEAKARIEREIAFALLTTPSVSYQLRAKREGERAGSFSLTKNGGSLFSANASYERGWDSKMKAEVRSSIDGYVGNANLNAEWRRTMTRATLMSANGSIIIEGFGMENDSSAEITFSKTRPDGGAFMELHASTPLLRLLETLYILVDYNGIDEIIVKARTVFEGYEDLEATAKWIMKDLNGRVIMSVRKNEDSVTSDLKLIKKPGLFHLTTNATTSFEGFEEMDSIWRFQRRSDDPNDWSGEIEMKMNMYEEVIYGLEGHLKTFEKAADTQLIIYTPDIGYETITTKFSYDFLGETEHGKFVKAHGETEERLLLNGSGSLKEGVLDIKLNAPIITSTEIDATSILKNWRDSETRVKIGKHEGTLILDLLSDNDGKIKFTSNIEGYEILETKWNYTTAENKARRLEAGVVLGAKRDGKFVLNMTPDLTKLVTDVLVKFPEGQKYHLEGMWELVPESREFMGILDISWAELGQILAAEVTAQAPQGALAAKAKAFSSQWREGKEVTLSFGLEYEEKGATAESVLRWGDSSSETISLNGKLEVASLKAVSNLEITTPFMKPLTVSLDYDFLHESPKKLAALYQYGDITYTLNGEVNPDHFDFQMMTPISEYRVLKIKASRILNRGYKEIALAYELGEGSRGEIKASASSEPNSPYELNLFASLDGTLKCSLKGKWSMTSPSRMYGDLDIKWGEEGSVTLLLEWDVPERARLEAFSSSWRAPMFLSWKSSVPGQGNRAMDLEVILQSSITIERKLRFSAGVSPEKGGITEFEAELETPGENGKWAAKGTLAKKNRDDEYTVRATLLREEATVAEVEGTLSRDPGLHSKIALAGGEAVFQAGYDLRENDKEAHLLAVYGKSHRIEAKAKGTLDQNAARVSLVVETSFTGMKKLTVEAELGGNNEEREAALRAEWDGGRVEVTGSGAYIESIGFLRGRFALRTPWKPLELLELDAKAEIKGPTYSLNATLGTATDYYVSTVGTLDLSNREGEITVVLSRIGGVKPARFYAAAVLRPKDLLRIRVETPFLVTVDVSGRRIEDEYDVISDAEWGEGQKMTLKGKIRSQPEDYGFNGEMEWNGKRLALDAFTKGSAISPRNCSVKGGFNLTTPYPQMPHMNMLFSLLKEEDRLLEGRLDMKTPFKALPTLSAAVSLKVEEDQGMIGELKAASEKSHMKIGAKIRKDLLGRNIVNLEIHLPFLGKSSPLTFDCTLDCRKPNWREVLMDLKVVISESVYGTSLTYNIENYGLNASFKLNSPKKNFKGGLSGLYKNHSLGIRGYFNENDFEVGYTLDKEIKDLVGNLSLNGPTLGIPNIGLHFKVSYLQDIKTILTYKYREYNGSINFLMGVKGVVADFAIPPMITSPTSIKVLFSRVSRGYDLNAGFSHGKSNHSLDLSMESYENLLVKGKLLSTYLGDRDIDIFLRKDRKIGQAKIGGFIGVRWDGSQPSALTFGFMWKNMEHKGKIEVRTVGRYAVMIEMSSPWLPTGGFNTSALYSNEIESFRAEVKCETKKGIHKVSLEATDIQGKKTIKGEIMKYSKTLADFDAAVFFGDGVLDGSAKITYSNSSHSISVILQAIPITLDIHIDSDYLKKRSSNSFSVTLNLDTDAMKGYAYILTPFTFLESANLTASCKFTNNGHLNVETTASVIRYVDQKQINQIVIASLKVPYPPSNDTRMKQYMVEVLMVPENYKILASLNYEFGRGYGMVDTNFELDLGQGLYPNPYYYEIRAYEKLNIAELSTETSGVLVWAGEKYGEIGMEAGMSEEWNSLVFSGKAITRENETYVSFIEVTESTGKIEIGWPQDKKINIQFEHEIESWEAFRIGVTATTPFLLLNDVSMKLKSVIKEEGYECEIRFRKEKRRLAVSVEGAFANEAPNFIIVGGIAVDLDGAKIGEIAGHLRLLCGSASIGMDLTTPWSNLKELHFLAGADWRIKGSNGPSLKLEVSHNGYEYLATAADIASETIAGGVFIRTLWTRPISLRYQMDFESLKVMSGSFKACNGHCVGINFTVNGTKEIIARLELPTREVGLDWVWVADPKELHASTRIMWDREHSLGFDLLVLSLNSTRIVWEVDLPVRSFKVIANSGMNDTNFLSHSNLLFYWDATRNISKVISFELTIARHEEDGSIDASLAITHPELRRSVIIRLSCTSLRLPFEGKLELDYSPDKADLFVAETSLARTNVADGRASKLALIISMRHQRSGLDIRVGAEGSAGMDKAGGQLGAQYIDTRGRQRTIVLSAKAHRMRRSLQLKADTNENSLAIKAALEDVGLRLETKVNRKPPLTLRLLIDRKMPSASFDADRGRRRYKIYFGSTEASGSGPIKSVTMRLTRRDVDDDAPPSTIAIAPAVETVLSGTTVSLNSSRVLSSRFLWEQRGGLRTPDVPATLGAAFGTMGGWIRDAYSDVGHAWAAVAGEAAAGFLGEGTTHKLKLWYASIEDEVEGLAHYSKMEVRSLVEDFRSLEEMLHQMYGRNDFFIQDIDHAIMSSLQQINTATSCVLKFLKEAVIEAYVLIRKVTSSVVSSASRLVGDAIEATGSAVSSALPDPAEAARKLGEAAGRVAATASRVGAAARGAARRLAAWAEGVIEAARAWIEERKAMARQAVWDWATEVAERMRPVLLTFHSYVLRFKEILEEIHAMADEISISIAENLANVREIMELGELVDYYTFKIRNLKWDDTIASLKAYLKRTWATVVEDFKNGLGEYRQKVLKKYEELIGHYDQFMQLPPVVEFTGTVKFIYRKAIWTWQYLELGDHLKTIVTDFAIDLIKKIVEIAGQITEASRDPNSAAEHSRDSSGDSGYREEDRKFVLEAGYFEYNVKLPFDWDSFDSVPHFRQMWEVPKETESTHRADETLLGPNRPGSTAFTRIRSLLADALLDASSAAAITEATDGNLSTAAALAALALPPFPSSALIAGESHLVTFDGRDYGFKAAGCSYLLAGDLTGGTFSILANYDEKGHRRSVSVILPPEPIKGQKGAIRGSEVERRIDVGSDGRVSMDGRRVELPIEEGPAAVRREGERVVVEVGRPNHSSSATQAPATIEVPRISIPLMVLECNPFHNVCTVRISGWFFSRTAGLLGTYDNEPSNDFESPDGRIYSKGQEGEFVESWHVGNCTGDAGVIEGGGNGNSRSSFLSPTPSQSSLATATEPCEALFNRESDIMSPLQPCFSRVDPAPYGRLCEVDVAAASNSPSGWETAACASAAAYVAQCRNAGMDLWVPQSCVRCYLSDGSVLSAGETKVYGGDDGEGSTPAPSSGDVVFLIEQRPCLKGTQLANLAIKLDSSMKARGLRDNRFALVGFNGGYKSRAKAGGSLGGVMVSRVFGGPHTHTVDGKVWSTRRHFEKAFHNMLFDGRDGSGPGGRTTPMEALWYAARLPFRDGVSKTIVLVMCGDCSDATDAAYADAVGMLLEGDLTLHVLAPTTLRTKRQPTGPPAAVGFDSMGAFTTRNVRSLAPSRDLMRQLAIPKDLCSPLALETNGTRFDVASVLGASVPGSSPSGAKAAEEAHQDDIKSKRQRKFALDVFVRRVALTASPSRCQKCDCVADREGVGRVACQRCLFPSMEQFLKEWESMYDDDSEHDEDDDVDSDKELSSWG